MKRYLIAYAAWLVGVLAMSAIAIAWYKRVENIGLREVVSRMSATEAPEATDTDTDNGAE